MMRLKDELAKFGCKVDESTFLDTLADVYDQQQRDRPLDDFLCDPWDEIIFCTIISLKFGMPHDREVGQMILRRLLNTRKYPSRSRSASQQISG